MVRGWRGCLYREVTCTRAPRILSPTPHPQTLGTRGASYCPSQQHRVSLPPSPHTHMAPCPHCRITWLRHSFWSLGRLEPLGEGQHLLALALASESKMPMHPSCRSGEPLLLLSHLDGWWGYHSPSPHCSWGGNSGQLWLYCVSPQPGTNG